ncbi:hypothetical protein ACFVH6_12235 [Spirillospora sp. NPDC127200]
MRSPFKRRAADLHAGGPAGVLLSLAGLAERVAGQLKRDLIAEEAESDHLRARLAEAERELALLRDEHDVFEREANASQARAADAVSVVFAAFDRAMTAHGFLGSTRRQVAALAGEELTRTGEVFRGQDLPSES